MKHREMERICEQLSRSLTGPTWHGPAVLEILTGVTAQQAYDARIGKSHSLWEIILHMDAWTKLTMATLAGEEMPGDPPMAKNFPKIKAATDAQWLSDIEEMKQSMSDLVDQLKEKNDDFLKQTVPGRQYDFYFLLHGLVQHHLYHAGQLILLKKHI